MYLTRPQWFPTRPQPPQDKALVSFWLTFLFWKTEPITHTDTQTHTETHTHTHTEASSSSHRDHLCDAFGGRLITHRARTHARRLLAAVNEITYVTHLAGGWGGSTGRPAVSADVS